MFEGYTLNVMTYDPVVAHVGDSGDTCRVQVTGLHPTTSDDTLQYFLESKGRTGGGPIVSVHRETNTTAVVVFEEAEGMSMLMTIHYVRNTCSRKS